MKRIILVFIFIIVMSNIANATTFKEEEDNTPQDLKMYFEEFNKLSDENIKNNFQQIIDILNIFLHKYPDNKVVKLRFLNAVAHSHICINKFDDARYYLEQAYKLNPESARVNNGFGYLEYSLMNYDEALKYYNRVLMLDDDNHERSGAEQNIAAVYFEQKNYLEAIKHYNESINYDQKAILYHFRGTCFAEMKDFSTAIKDYNQAISMDSKLTGAYQDRAWAYLKLKNYNSSLNDYYKTLELDPEHKNVYFQIGYCYSELKNYSKSIEAYTKYLYYYPDDKVAYYNRGLECGKIGDYPTAIENFTQAILLDPNYGLAYKYRGITYRKMGSEEQAKQDLQKAKNLGA